MKTNHAVPTVHQEPPEAWIRERAYYLWLTRGCPQGDDLQDWLDAKAQFTAETSPATARLYPNTDDTLQHFSIRETIDQHQSDPAHRFHAPSVAHDARLNVAANEAPQRIRGRHFENAERQPGKKG